MKTVLFLSKRYLFSKKGNNAINIIVYIASIGVFFASMAFIIVLSGFSGIRSFNLNLINLTDPQLIIVPKTGKKIYFNDSINNILKKEQNIVAFSKVLEEKVFIDYHNKQKIAKIKGVDSNFYKVIPIDTTILLGKKPMENLNEILIGVGLANDLGIIISSANNPQIVRTIVPKPGKGIISDPRKAFNSKYFFPTGIFQTSSDHDGLYVYTSLSQVQDLLQVDKSVISQVELKVKNKSLINNIKNKLKQQLGKNFNILDQKEQKPLLFKMLNTENLMTYFILLLILLLALFNIIGSLIMIILDKENDIKILNILGLEISQIKKIFLAQGISMTLLSGIGGLLVGIILVIIQMYYPFLFISQTNLAYPVEIHFSNIFIVITTIVILSIFSTSIAVKRIKQL